MKKFENQKWKASLLWNNINPKFHFLNYKIESNNSLTFGSNINSKRTKFNEFTFKIVLKYI